MASAEKLCYKARTCSQASAAHVSLSARHSSPAFRRPQFVLQALVAAKRSLKAIFRGRMHVLILSPHRSIAIDHEMHGLSIHEQHGSDKGAVDGARRWLAYPWYMALLYTTLRPTSAS